MLKIQLSVAVRGERVSLRKLCVVFLLNATQCDSDPSAFTSLCVSHVHTASQLVVDPWLRQLATL